MTDTARSDSTASPARAPLLELRNVSGGYGPVQVLHDIDLVVETGKVVVVLGANGAGKTTTLRAICGMIATKGSIFFDGQPVPRGKPDKVARLGIAHVPQGRGTFVELTVEDNLRLGAYVRKGSLADDLDRWYTTFPRLAERRGQAAGSMSGGEQQMLAIARAMMSRPRLLLLDEPSLGLAPLITQDLFRTLGDINEQENLTVLVVEQNANLALDIGHHGYVLETGRIVTHGPADQLRSDDGVRRAYLGF